ncbi:MAG TPA: DegV family protein [Ktedonosporobacter sp.]|jgi:DegV family protein with EDD domain|nr:DegV family protein [Ktedonosporobacter sp.]
MVVRIVTDSTADISVAQAEALNITIVPLTVFFGDDAYLDNIELDNAAFYKKLQESKDLPRTSQPSPAAFDEAFTRLINEGADAILSVHLSSKLSGTYQSACTARDALPENLKKIPIEIVDSQSISVGMSYPVMEAARKAQSGAGLEEIKAHLLDQLARTRILAVLDTLEYVKRGGRIGGAKALLGNMLSFKPIISLKDGEVIPLEQPRTRNKAYVRLAQLVGEMEPIEYIAIAEASDEVGQQLAQALKATYSGEIPIYKLGGVLGTHTGPGTAAVSVVTAS